MIGIPIDMTIHSEHPSVVNSCKCAHCGFTSNKMDDFREFIGNVFVPNCGGLIGNNFFHFDPTDDDEPNAVKPFTDNELGVIKASRIKIDERDGGVTHICSTVLCLPCVFETMRLPDHKAYPSGHPHAPAPLNRCDIMAPRSRPLSVHDL